MSPETKGAALARQNLNLHPKMGDSYTQLLGPQGCLTEFNLQLTSPKFAECTGRGSIAFSSCNALPTE